MLHLPRVPQHYASYLAQQYLLLVHQETYVLLWRKTGVDWVRLASDCFDVNLNDGTHHHFCVGNALEKIYNKIKIEIKLQVADTSDNTKHFI